MKKYKASRKKIDGVLLMKKTFHSYSTKEKWVSVLLVVIALFTGWKGVTGNWQGQDVTSIFTGGHNYNEGIVGEIARLNPVYADLNEVDRDITSLIFEGLAKYDPATRSVVENIATHTLDTSKTTYTFTMKDGPTWQDSTPVTADDIYFTFHDVIQHPEFENPILKANFSGVTIEQIDTKTVTFKLNEPNSFFFTQVTVGLLPKHLLSGIPIKDLDTNEFNQKPIGNGPYQVNDSYERSQDGSSKVSLEYYKDYWTKAKPDITEINFLTFPTYEQLKQARNKLHGIARVQQYRLSDLQVTRLNAYAYDLPQYTALFLDTDNEILRERNVRLAIQKAIDSQKIIKTIGYNKAIDTPLLELDQEDWIYQANPKEAAGALFDAGWKLDSETGKRIKEERDEKKYLALRLVRRSYPNNERLEETTRTTAEILKTQLEAVGIGITLESYEEEAFQKKVSDREYDLLLYGQSLGYNLDTHAYWHSSQSRKGLNLSNYGNAKADFSIEAIRNSFGEESETRNEYLQKLAETIKNDVPAVFLYTPTYYFLAENRILNIQTEHLLFPHDRFANILEWKVGSTPVTPEPTPKP